MKPVYIFDTFGDWQLTLLGEHLFDLRGEWVGWIDGNEVFTTDGEYVGEISKDRRILRKRVKPTRPLHDDIPSHPGKPELPARAPLPPMFAELPYDMVDMFDHDPDIFRRTSSRRPDMD